MSSPVSRLTVAREDVVVQALNGARQAAQRPVGVQDDGASRGEQDKARDADKTGVHEAGTGRDAGQHRREGQQRQGEQGSHVDERDGRKAADRAIGVQPRG